MSFPQIQTKIELSDYILVEVVGGPETRYKIYKKDNYSKYPVDTSLAEILIPYYCGEPKVKLGAFLPQFDKILCELLVVALRAFNNSGSGKLPISSTLITPCFRCFSLRYCHFLHLLFIIEQLCEFFQGGEAGILHRF